MDSIPRHLKPWPPHQLTLQCEVPGQSSGMAVWEGCGGVGIAEGLLLIACPLMRLSGRRWPPSQVSGRNERQKGLVSGQLPVPTRAAQPLAASVESQLQQLGWGLCPRDLSLQVRVLLYLTYTPLQRGGGACNLTGMCMCVELGHLGPRRDDVM